jgi:hypothetical protein
VGLGPIKTKVIAVATVALAQADKLIYMAVAAAVMPQALTINKVV